MTVTTGKSNTSLSVIINVILEFSNNTCVRTRPQTSARGTAITISAGCWGPDSSPCVQLPEDPQPPDKLSTGARVPALSTGPHPHPPQAART